MGDARALKQSINTRFTSTMTESKTLTKSEITTTVYKTLKNVSLQRISERSTKKTTYPSNTFGKNRMIAMHAQNQFWIIKQRSHGEQKASMQLYIALEDQQKKGTKHPIIDSL